MSFIEFSLWIAEQNVVSKDFVTVIDCIEHIGIQRLEATEQEPSSHELDRRIRCERSVLKWPALNAVLHSLMTSAA